MISVMLKIFQINYILIHNLERDIKAASKISALVLLLADFNCNINGYSSTSNAYSLSYRILRLDGTFKRGRRKPTEFKMAPFNENFINLLLCIEKYQALVSMSVIITIENAFQNIIVKETYHLVR